MKLFYSCLAFFALSTTVYSQSVNFEWAIQSGGSSEDQGQSIMTDAAGFVYVAGYFSGIADFDPSASIFNLTSNGGKDIFIQKLDQNSNFVWAKSFGSSGDDVCNSIDITGSGDILLTGVFEGTVDFDPSAATVNLVANGGNDIFIQKLDSNGDLVWAKSFGDVGIDRGLCVGVDESDNIYITGRFEGIVDFDPGAATYALTSNGDMDAFIQKLDMNGSFLWCKSFGGLGADYAISLDIDYLGNVYLTGAYYSDSVDFDPGVGSYYLVSNGSGDIFVQKLDQTGNFNWAVTMGGWSMDFGRSVVCDTLGNVYTTGSFSSTVDFDPSVSVASLNSSGSVDGYIQKLDSDGNYIWAKSFGGNDQEYPKSISIDKIGGIYVTGSFEGTADFDPSVATSNLISNGMSDVFIEKLDSDGIFIWAKSIGDFSYDEVQSIAIDNSGNIYTTGSFKMTPDFDPSTNIFYLSSNGNSDIFVQKLSQSFVNTIELDAYNTVSIYPNPNQGIINIDLGELSNVAIKIYDASGRLVHIQSDINSPSIQLELDGSSGIYILELEYLEGKKQYQLVKQ